MTPKRVEEKWSRDSWILGGIIGGLVLTFIAISLVYLKGIADKAREDKARDQFITCVRNWSDAYTRRTDLLQQLSSERTDALDAYIHAEGEFLRTLARHNASSKTAFARLLAASSTYADASDAYTRATRRHPVPASPQFVCSHGRQGVAPGHVADGTSAPTAVPTSAAVPTKRPARPVTPTPAAPPAVVPTFTARPTPPTVTTTRSTTRTVTPPPNRSTSARPTRSTNSSSSRPGGPLPSVICGLPLLCNLQEGTP